MARTKKTVIVNVSPAQANEAFKRYALNEAKENQIKAEIAEKTTLIRAEYDGELLTIEAEKKADFEVLETYATENRAKLFAKKKSKETPFGLFGFRTGTPKLKPLKGYTFEICKRWVNMFLPDYIRTTTEINKQAIIDDRDEGDIKMYLERCGLSIIQDETFFIEPKKVETPATA